MSPDARRPLTRRDLVAAAAAAASGTLAGAAPARPARPNVLVFFTDQQRWDTCGCLAPNAPGITPNLDRMAARGTVLSHAFTCQPVCAPARASFQTGLHGTRHCVWRNGIPLDPARPTLATRFREAGYRTGYIGKWHLANTRALPVPRELRGGYEHWLAADALEHTSHPYDFRVFDAENREVRRPGYRVDAQTDCVLDYLRERAADRANPFFLFVSYLEPHHQNDANHFVAPAGYADRFRADPWVPADLRDAAGGDWKQELPDYLGAIARLDENLGRVLAALRTHDLDRSTIVLFASDHGCHFRTRNSEYKRSCHEASIRVPAVFQGPSFDRAATIADLVSTPDWTATLLDAAGLRPMPDCDGRSVLPLLRGSRRGWPREVFLQISESQVGRAIRTQRWKYGVTAPGLEGGRVPSSDAYVEQYLYDLEADPAEQHNLCASPRHRATAARLRATLIRRMVEAGEAPPRIQPA